VGADSASLDSTAAERTPPMFNTKHLSFAIVSVAAAACGGSSQGAITDTTATDSALLVSPSSNTSSLTLSSSDGTCADPRTVVEAHADELKALCGDQQIPVPGDVVADGCTFPDLKSITFKCVDFKAPKGPANGCVRIDVKDAQNAIPASGADHIGAAMPPLLCPMIGGAPPPPPPPPNADGGVDGPPPMPPQGGGSCGDDDHRPRPGQIECCAPPPPPPGGPGGGASAGGGGGPAPAPSATPQ
jgi:hypothetical protein